MRLALFGAVAVAFASALATFACSSSPAPAAGQDSGTPLPDDEPIEPPAPVEVPPIIPDYDASTVFDNDAGTQCSGAVQETEPNNSAGSENAMPWQVGTQTSICGRVTAGDPTDLVKFTISGGGRYTMRYPGPQAPSDSNVSIVCTDPTGVTFNLNSAGQSFPYNQGTTTCSVTLNGGTLSDWRVDLKMCEFSAGSCAF